MFDTEICCIHDADSKTTSAVSYIMTIGQFFLKASYSIGVDRPFRSELIILKDYGWKITAERLRLKG